MPITRTMVNRFSHGTAEYIVMHGRWQRSRGRNYSAVFDWLRNPRKAYQMALSMAYFPQSGAYLNGQIPDEYICGECGASGVKLWREYNTFLENQSLRCMDCACREQSKVRTPTEDGKSLYTEKVHHWYRTEGMRDGSWLGYDPEVGPPSEAIETRTQRDRTDQIGWRIPAVPTEDGTYWGYTSVPSPGCDWWDRLPYTPEQPAKAA